MNADQMTGQIELVFHLEKAIESDEFELYFQPIIHTISGSLCGFEALVRWHHPEYGFLNPSQFVGVLEDTKQIHHLDIHMIKKVCQWYRREKVNERPVVPVSVNLSRIDFETADMFRVIEELTTKYSMPRSMLNIEITESAFAGEGGLMGETIKKFREAGYQVWMDDFGSGYSSLNTLKDYVFDELKIDMGFLSDFTPRSKRIISSMISMAKDIGMVSLVEGVETREQVDFLYRVGCDRLQGYYFSRPLPYDQLMLALKEKGIRFESEEDRQYYHAINRINILSPSPFEVGEYERQIQSSGIPLAVLERTDSHFRFLYNNDRFVEDLKVIGAEDAEDAVNRLIHFGILSREEIEGYLTQVAEQGERKIEFSVNGDLCSARAKLICRSGARTAMLLSISNITQTMDINHEHLLDQSLMNIYSLYLRVSILRPQKNEMVTVFSSGQSDFPTDVVLDMAEITKAYSRTGVLPEDQTTYLDFLNPATIEARIQDSPRGFINVKIHTRDEDGGYSNKMYLAVAMGNHEILLLMRYANL